MNTRHPLQVLFVEDSEDDVILLEAELQRAGFSPSWQRVETRAAMAAALKRQPWDLVIADYVMPHFDGLTALGLIRELGLDLPFIVVSGHISEDTAVAAMKAGAHDYLMKDNLARLGAAVRRELLEAEIRQDRHQAEARLLAEHAITRLLAVANDLSEAAPGILKILLENLDLDLGTLWVLDASQHVLRVMVEHVRPDSEVLGNYARTHRRLALGKGEGIAGRAWRELLPICTSVAAFGKTGEEAPPLIKSMLAFPIQSGGTVFGVLEFWARRPVHAGLPLMNMLTVIGSELGQFIQRRNAEAALRQTHAELELRVQKRTAELRTANSKLETAITERKRLEQELLEITEKERRRIGLDLHDDLGQKLSGIALMTKGLELRLAKTNSGEAREAARIHELVQQTLDHASDLAQDLATLDFTDKDLSAAVERLAAHASKLFSVDCRFKMEGPPPALDANAVRQVYKIAQEAVTNAIKHGKAKRVEVLLSTGPRELTLTVRNSGLPFPDLQGRRTGMGLRIMNYRANLLNGTLIIKGQGIQGGTILTCSIPLGAAKVPG